MKKLVTLCLFSLSIVKATGQQMLDVNIKPTECAFLNFETHIGIGSAAHRYGLILAYRTSTQSSGQAESIVGAGADYGRRCFNNLYDGYTLGLYDKRYLNKETGFFLEADAFYRNWHFNKKQAEYDNVERAMHSFNGVRTENVDVYCLKLLVGKTLAPKAKKERKIIPYLDIYGGLGVRYQVETYETFNGTAGGSFYTYHKDQYNHFWPTPQFGITLGLIRQKTASTEK
jgi:hypothetical protein